MNTEIQMTKVLIDADPIVWAIGCVVKDDPIENALHTVKLKLNDIIEKNKIRLDNSKKDYNNNSSRYCC